MAKYEACVRGLKMDIDMNVYELFVIRDSDLLIHQVQGEWVVKNPKIIPYVHYVQKLCKRFCNIEFRHTIRVQNELADVLATIASMIKHLDTDYIGPLDIELKEHPLHYFHVETEPDGLPWRTPDLGLLRCIDVVEAVKLIEQIHAGVCAWGMDVIGPIQLATYNGHRFILVAIYHFTKWVEEASYKSNIDWCYALLTTIWNRGSHTAEIDIASLRIIQEAELSNVEWLRKRIDQLTMIDDKRIVAVYHGKLYRKRMVRAFHKRVRAIVLEVGQLVLKHIFPHQDEYKGKFAPNWQGLYMVYKVLSGGALVLSEMNGTVWPNPINSNAVKRYYV
ncbi:uncharacterized protein [Solanum lycopersicum]|uniref:uncharacterized protein n=1 Tax=Solanum lycopersicum TaxID=4081 RepID=UPI003748540A